MKFKQSQFAPALILKWYISRTLCLIPDWFGQARDVPCCCAVWPTNVLTVLT